MTEVAGLCCRREILVAKLGSSVVGDTLSLGVISQQRVHGLWQIGPIFFAAHIVLRGARSFEQVV